MRRQIISIVSLLSIVFAVAVMANGQRLQVPQVSQKASVMQRIGLSDVSITYSRPAVKSRVVYGDWPTPVAGEATLDNQNTRPAGAPLVPWGHVWRAGANEATVFVVNDDVLINGQPLAAGKYELAMIPIKDGDWTVIFNKDADQWGAFSYDDKKDVLRVKTKPEWGSTSSELLTYTIDGVSDDSAVVTLRWEKAVVPFTVKVPNASTKAIAHLKTAIAAAQPDDWRTPLQAAGYASQVKSKDDAKSFLDAALKAVDVSIAAKPTFQNLAGKTTILLNAGRKDEAFATADKAIAQGKADKADTAAFEKRIADLKAGKM